MAAKRNKSKRNLSSNNYLLINSDSSLDFNTFNTQEPFFPKISIYIITYFMF